MIDWTEENLGNILKFHNGKAIKVLSCGKYPVYGSNGKIGFSNESRFCKSIIIGRVGAYCGSVYLELDEYWASDNTIVATVKNKNNLNFVYFLLRSFPLNDLAGGSAQPLLNQSILSRIKIKIPPLKTQQKIAAILSTYDDLIENNKRRINLLEKMAEDIYREWFVRFRFPGWQNTDFDKGIPKGWEVKRIKNIVKRKKYGKIYKQNELENEGEIIVIDQSKNDFLGFYNGVPEHIASPHNPIIVFGDHTCKMTLMLRDFSLAENVIPFLPVGSMPVYFLFHLIKDKATTTEYKRHWTELTTQNVLIPHIELQKKFSHYVVSIYQQIENYQNIILNLDKTKNQLLSRLISGKLSVDNLNIKFPSSME
ncbi:restriction endonuclease subunit S [Cyanothece sp. BG0011]|uniref:restriction endonuclease subunit S n=1 Tax=Cyanothece sp. BG0011 TaxID=2082950 RepID=UPI000D1E86D8|nr:restriction endonuclease subunit S [Cyanothece sp. BG0011]